MKVFYLMISILAAFLTGENIYDLNIATLNGNQVSLSQFAGKKLIIATFDASSPDTIRLRTLDSLQRANPDSINVIAIAARDFADNVNADSLKLLCDSLSLSFPVTLPMYVKRGASQDSLAQWLTDADKNRHFSDDIDIPYKLFVIDDQGILYATESGSLSMDYINKVLHQDVIY